MAPPTPSATFRSSKSRKAASPTAIPTSYAYDGLGRKVAVTDPLTNTTHIHAQRGYVFEVGSAIRPCRLCTPDVPMNSPQVALR
jgi:YD repeat-containing protein